MNPLLLILIKALVSVPIAYFVLQYFFKKSIMLYLGLILILASMAVAIATKLELLGYINPVINYLLQITIVIYGLSLFSKLIKKPLLETISQIEELSEKNLNIEIDRTRGKYEIKTMNIAIDKLRQTYLNIVVELKTNASNLYNASAQLSSASLDIAQNANEQAVTTEEVSSSVEEMLSMVKSNTQNAITTEVTTTKSAQEIKQSQEAFLETILSVSKISEKTSVITEISKKTDILSVNAAIEAARAGEVGKGFAVVAHEIRQLADKTKNASDDISELSEKGQTISKIAEDKLNKLIPQIVNSSELVNNIVIAGNEQQNGIEEINTSMVLLSGITNNNSAAAEELSASAEELSAQATLLKDLVADFKT